MRRTAILAVLSCGVGLAAACASDPPTSGVDPDRTGELTDGEIEALCRFRADLLADGSDCTTDDEYLADYELCLEHPPHIGGCGYPDVRAFEACTRALLDEDCADPDCEQDLCL